eukprot:2482328-Amphidinium_carterae.1
MACMIGIRKIQESSSCAEPLGLAHTPPRGRYKKKNNKKKNVLFDMVAELAIAERVIGLAIVLTRIVVTRASQPFTTIAWICGFCVGTISAYMEGAT